MHTRSVSLLDSPGPKAAGRRAVLYDSYCGAATPPYPFMVGRTCWSAEDSRQPAQRRWRSAMTAPGSACQTANQCSTCERHVPPHPNLLSRGEVVVDGVAMPRGYRLVGMTRCYFPRPKGDGLRVRGKGVTVRLMMDNTSRRDLQSGLPFRSRTGRHECRPSDNGLL